MIKEATPVDYKSHSRSGMTILELSVVTFVVAALVSFLGMSGRNILQRARVRAAKGNISTLAVAVQTAYRDTGIIPTDLADLQSSSAPSGVSGSRWHGPYAETVPLTDPWGNNYFFYFDVASTFGPVQFERTAGGVYDETFPFTAALGTGTLQITNDGVNHAAQIWINGEEICSPDDFQNNIPSITRTVDLQESNTIRIWLASNPGSYITVNVVSQLPSNITYHLGSFGKDGVLGGEGFDAEIEHGRFSTQ